jgi:hypothetical protein
MAGRRWDLEFHPAGADKITPSSDHPAPGTRVVLTPVGPGVRRSAVFAHISHAETGQPLGYVRKRSLMRVSQKRGGNPQPDATDAVLGLWRDRRGEDRDTVRDEPDEGP